MRHLVLLIGFIGFNILPSSAQWSNRYPKVDGYGHHVYLEGHELPVLNAGPTDPAPSPQNNEVVFAAKGWLWLMNLATMEATRITFFPGIDSRPNWSPKGDKIVFVRDNGKDLQIVLLDLNTKKESILVDTTAMDMDPIFSRDGNSVYYSSAQNGSLDIWKINLATLEKVAITNEAGLERLPIPTNNPNHVIYLKKEGFSYDSIELLDIEKGTSTPLAEENFISQTAFTMAPDNETLAYTWPNGDNYELRLLSVSVPKSNLLITKSEGLPLTPKFSYNGDWIYFAEYNKQEVSELKRVPTKGGKTQHLQVKKWNWGTTMGKLNIVSKVDGVMAAVRMSITDKNGSPIIPDSGIVHSDGQNGTVFFLFFRAN